MTIEELTKKDTNFNSTVFISKANNMIKKLYNSVTLDELDTVDHFASDKVFNVFKSELEEAKNNNEVLIYDQVNIQTDINNVVEEDGLYKIICSVYCKFCKYYLDSNGKLLRGDKDNRIEIEKTAIFCKRVDAKEDIVARCLGCGTPLNINDNGKCPNCGRIFDLELFGYYLDSFE